MRDALPKLPALNQRQRDVLGLALIALGVFMGVVLYGSGPTAGGGAGHALAVAFGWALGRARVLSPVAIALGGGVLLLTPVLPATRPLRSGAACLFAAVTMALASGTFGLSSGPARSGTDAFASVHLQNHGGIVGEALYQLAHRLVQSAGVDILVLFLLITAVVLLTGASVAGVLRATGSGLIDTTRKVRRGREEPPSAATRRVKPADEDGSLHPPEPEPEELVVRATHVEAPSRDWGDVPEFDADHDEQPEPAAEDLPETAQEREETDEQDEEIAGVAHADPADLTPQGRLRGTVTDDPDFVWQLPEATGC